MVGQTCERSGVQSPGNDIGSSFREGPAGQEGGADARMAKFIPRAVGVQGPRRDDTDVLPGRLLRDAVAAGRRDPAGSGPTARRRNTTARAVAGDPSGGPATVPTPASPRPTSSAPRPSGPP